jgi:uncharacterized membrane protein
LVLALLPFLGARMRTHRDTMVWLGAGMTAGLALVAAVVVAERSVFTGLFDFTTDYRVVGTFFSMNVGGGHISAYIAMALPFLLVTCFGHVRSPFLRCSASQAAPAPWSSAMPALPTPGR